MSGRNKFLKNFKIVSQKIAESIAIYNVLDSTTTLGITFFNLDKVTDELSQFFVESLGNTLKYLGVSVTQSFYLPYLVLSVWKAGGSFVGIGTQDSFQNTLNFLNFLDVQFFITDSDDEKFGGVIHTKFFIEQQPFFIWNRKQKNEPERLLNSDNINGICYGITTSGSTGVPKTIKVPWNCILPNIEELCEELEIKNSDCIFQATPHTFDPFFVELLAIFLTGCSLMIVSNDLKLGSSNLLKILFETRNEICQLPESSYYEGKNQFFIYPKSVTKRSVSVVQLTPSVFRRWSDEEIKESVLGKNSPLRILLLGGEKFPVEILNLKSADNKTKIFNIYGITEISCWAFLNEVTNHSRNIDVSLGKPLKDIIYSISDCQELFIGSKTRMCIVDKEDYSLLKLPIFRNSCDIVKKKNGELYYLNRSDQIVKKYGIKINLAAVENFFVKNNKNVKYCFCIYDEISKNLALFYVPYMSHTNEKKFYVILPRDFYLNNTKNFKAELKAVEQPDYFVEIPEIPLNSHGKFDKKKLVKYLKDILNAERPTSKDVFFKIWTEAFGTEKPDLYSKSFTALGGTSVLALEIINRLENMKVKVPQNFISELLGGSCFDSCFRSLSYTTEEFEHCSKKLKTEEYSFKDSDVKLFVLWKFEFEKCVDATPAVFNFQGKEVVVVGSHSSKLSCLDAENGSNIWTISLGDRIESKFTATINGTIGFIGCYDHHIYCISVANGQILWKYKTEDMIKSAPCLSTDEKVIYVASYDKYLYCFSVLNGQLLYKIKLSEGGIYCSGIVSNAHNIFYIATLDGTCVAIKEDTRQIIWTSKVETPVFASPCLLPDDSEILFTEVLGVINCFKALDGLKVWQYKAGGNIYSTPLTHSLFDSNFIIFGCHDSHTYCIQNDTGELTWKKQMNSSIFAKVSVLSLESFCLKEALCIATTKGNLYLLDVHSGETVAQLALGGEIFSSPVARKSRIYVGSRDNHVYCLDVRTLAK